MSAVPIELASTRPWRLALPAVLALVAAILLLYRDTALAMVEIWSRSDTFAHAFLVPPISLWLIWRQRERLALLTPKPQPWVLLPLLAVALVWLLADIMLVNAAAQFALVAMLVLAVPAVLGLQVAHTILFPLMFLFFAVPFGEFMLPAMMEWTADFVVFALQLTGVPVYREGMHFVIPSGNWSVIDECSGVRYLMASFMVGTLFAYLNYSSYKRRAIFMAVSIAMPIVANWLRAYIIVMLAHISGNKIAVGIDHILYGWVFFGVVIMIMFFVGARWSEPDEAAPEAPTGAALATAGGGQQRGATSTLGIAAAAALAILLPQFGMWGLQRAENAAAPAEFALPERIGDAWAANGNTSVWVPIFVNPSLESKRVYGGPQGTVGAYVAYYRGQGPDRKLVSSLNVFKRMRGSPWNQIESSTREVVVDGRALQVRSVELLADAANASGARSHLVAWRLYWIDGRWVGSDVEAKAHGALARLAGRGDEGAALVIYADSGSVAASHATLQAFMDSNSSRLDALLQQTRDKR
jgi:exosortase A